MSIRELLLQEKLHKALQAICEKLNQQEQAANVCTHTPEPSRRFNIIYDYDNDDEENTIPLNEITSQIPPSIAITPVLPTMEPEDSLSMGDKHLSTIPEKESDEFIKSSIKDLVPIPSESEDTSGGILTEKFDGMSIEINKKKELQQLEQAANLSTYTTEPSRRFNSFYDDDDYEESTIPLNEMFSKIPLSIVNHTSFTDFGARKALCMGALLVTPLSDANGGGMSVLNQEGLLIAWGLVKIEGPGLKIEERLKGLEPSSSGYIKRLPHTA
ncbi:hypothetical protein Tco_0862662 [Tanacetum coccineum]